MNWSEYTSLFEPILNGENQNAPYDQEVYVEYVKLNNARISRWLKKSPILDETKVAFSNLDKELQWILILEPWCGDASHSSPLIHLMSELSDKVNLEIMLRDSTDIIDDYLTNGGKAIPKLVIRDTEGNDLATWGPRPAEAQQLAMDMKNTDMSFQDRDTKLQQWYNKDKGATIQKEFIELIKSFN